MSEPDQVREPGVVGGHAAGSGAVETGIHGAWSPSQQGGQLLPYVAGLEAGEAGHGVEVKGGRGLGVNPFSAGRKTLDVSPGRSLVFSLQRQSRCEQGRPALGWNGGRLFELECLPALP